jgi:hypothetical protein
MRRRAFIGLMIVFASGCITFQNRYSLVDFPDHEGSMQSPAWATILFAGVSVVLAAACVWGFLKLQKLKQSLRDTSEPVRMTDSFITAAPISTAQTGPGAEVSIFDPQSSILDS